jgi:hypothetical protein
VTVTSAGRSVGLRSGRSLFAGMLFFGATIVLCLLALASMARPTVAVVWASLSLSAFSAALICGITMGHRASWGFACWKFGPWTLLWYGIVFGITTVTWTQPQTGISAEIEISSVLRATWLVAVGMAMLAIGYGAGPGRPARNFGSRAVAALQRRFSADIRGLSAPWILYAVGTAARLVNTATTGVFGYVGNPSSLVSSAASYGGIIDALTLCAPLALSAAALQVFRERIPGARVTLTVLVLAELVLSAVAGNKQGYIVAALAVVIPYSAVRHRLPKAVLVGLVLLFLIIVVPFNQAYRDTVRQGTVTLTPKQAADATPGVLAQTVTSQNLFGVLPQSLDYMMQRVRQIDSPAIIIQRTPGQIKYASPVQLIEGPIAGMIPRAVWPDKPIDVTGYQFNQQYFGTPPGLYTSTGETTIGSLYEHGGWIPVIAGMFMFGCGIRFLDDVLDVRTNPHVAFLLLMLFPVLIQGEEDWETVMAAIPGIAVTWVLALVLAFRRRREPS